MRKQRRIASVLTIITMGFALMVSAINWRTAAQQPQQADAPVEQKHPNIKVLKGLPESQLIPVMQFISASMGVNCAYCHVNNQGKWEFEKDDKKAKETARRMIQMTFDINKGNKDILGGAGVSCFTCHRGSTDPVNVPQLPLPAEVRGGGGERPAARPAAETLPTAAQVIDKYLQAVGGRAAAERLKTRVMKGSLIGSDGKEMSLETRVQSPDKVLTIITAPQGVITQGLTGTTGWIKTPKEQRELRGAELARFSIMAQTLEPLQITEAASNMRVGRGKVGDKDAIVLVWPVDETRTRRLYFDAQTGLLLRSITYMNTVLGRIPTQVDFEDYRDVDNVKLPFTIRLSSVDARNDITRKFTEIKVNVPVDAAQFNAPPAQK